MIFKFLIPLYLFFVGTAFSFVSWSALLSKNIIFKQQNAISSQPISMVATYAKTKQHLEKIKEKYSGRDEFDSVTSEVEDYGYFSDADAEEIDPPMKGQIVTGSVIEIDENGALLEIGGKMSGFIPLKEASLETVKNLNGILEVGQSVTAEVVGTLKGMPVLSLRSTLIANAWENILNSRAADATFEVTVTEVNRGGAVCNCFGLTAFIPGSHLVGSPSESLVGNKIKVHLSYLFSCNYKNNITHRLFTTGEIS